MTKYIFLLFFSLTFGCQSTPTHKPTSKTERVDDDKIEGNAKIKIASALTKTFSYRQLRWEKDEKEVVQKLGLPLASAQNLTLKFLTFTSKTRGIPTYTTTGLLENKFVTLDISIIDKTQCSDAIPKWVDALSLKYGPSYITTKKFVAWKLEDGTQIAIEKTEDCGIVYAKSAADRQAVNTLASGAISNKY